MIQRWLKGKTLAVRLTTLTILGEAIILVLFSTLVFHSSRSAMMKSFDHSVIAKAESILALLEVEDEEDGEVESEHDGEEGIEFEVNNGILPGSQNFDGSLPDEFMVIVDGEIIASSVENVEFLMESQNGAESEIFQYTSENGTHFRGVLLTQFRPTKTVIHTATIGYAVDITSTNSAILLLGQKIFGGAIMCLIFSALIAWYLARKTLEPVHDLIKQIKYVGSSFIGRRIDSSMLSPDLIPLSDSINAMILQIEDAFAREKEFSSDAAHELRSPIASLKSSVQSSLIGIENSESAINCFEVIELLESLLDDIDRMGNLCEALLLLTTVNSQEEKKSLTLSEWKQEIFTAIECIKGLPSADGATFKIQDNVKEVDDLRIQIDQSSVFRIAENLLDNALRHGGSQISIQITLSENKENAMLMIEDNGVGISEKYHAKIFERFFRVDESRDRKTGGTGLGLSICQTLAKNYDGEIMLESHSSGGSRFVWKSLLLKTSLAE